MAPPKTTPKKKSPKEASTRKAEKTNTSSAPKVSDAPKKRSGTILYQNDLIIYAAVRKGLPKPVVEKTLSALIEAIEETLSNGGEVRIPGFGQFLMRHANPRQAFNIKTRKMTALPATRRPVFKASQVMRDRMK